MNRHQAIATILFLAVLFSPCQALAVKGKYDKVTGLTEYKTSEMIANYGFWSGSYIFFRMIALQSEEKNETRAFINVRSLQSVNLLDDETPLYLLIDNKERLSILPTTSKTYEPGGTGVYWGSGISTYKKRVYQYLSYEVNAETLKKIQTAERIDCRIAGKGFDIEKGEIKKFKELADFVLSKQASQEAETKATSLKISAPLTNDK